jgi:hypothetical protein
MSRSRQFNQHGVSDPVYRTFQRACLAVCIVLVPVVLFLGFALDPTGGLGVPENLQGVAASIKAVSPLQVQWFLYLNAVTVYFFPLSFIGLGLLTMRRSPWLASSGMIFGLAGSLPFAAFVPWEALAFRVASSASAVAIFQYVNSQGSAFLLGASWMVGHLVGYNLTGIALLRSRAIPWWAAGLFIVGIPLQAAGYGTRQNSLQLICFALIVIGSLLAALAVLKGRDEPGSIT